MQRLQSSLVYQNCWENRYGGIRMKIKVEFQKGIDEHELGEIKEIWYKYNEYYGKESRIVFTDVDGNIVKYFMSDILTLSVEE